MHLRAHGDPSGLTECIVGRVSTADVELSARPEHVLLRSSRNRSLDTRGYCAVLSFEPAGEADADKVGVFGVPNLDYLGDGDVVALHPSGLVEVMYRRQSPHNTFLTTERCNSLCIMCSQPPKDVDDAWRLDQMLRAIDLMSPECRELGLTGGEPTLLGEGFFSIVERCRRRLPSTALHVLTNGRLFADSMLADRLVSLSHPDLMLGVPLYSDLDHVHDFVVQVKGAFDETIEGLYNLGNAGVGIELRMVLHASTVSRLSQFAEFVVRHLPFVDQVALMGLEMFGYVHQNLSTVWIDPADYQDQLEDATFTLALHGLQPVIFNHQLCVLRKSLWPFAVKSISDWKNVYLPACTTCAVKGECGGFFQSGTKRFSRATRPIDNRELQ